MQRKHVLFLIGLTTLDQITKFIIQWLIDYKQEIALLPDFFYFTNYHNHGSSFRMLNGSTSFYLVCIVLGIFVFYKFYRVSAKSDTCLLYGILCIMSGSLGNLIDRVLFQYVRDFIMISIPNFISPIFNIADIAIGIGFLLILYTLFKDAYVQIKKMQ